MYTLHYFTTLRVHEHGSAVCLRFFNHHIDNAARHREWKSNLDRTGILVKQFASRFHQAIQIQLGKDNFQTALQITYSILLVRVMLHNVFDRFVGDDNLLRLERHL